MKTVGSIETDRHAYGVGWITILPVEFMAARAMVDQVHKCPPKPRDDPNIYATGSINGHNVVIACAGEAGPNAANHCATHLMRTFPRIRIGLLSGIGGGIPSPNADIRLGDVVVSRPGPRHGGVVYYDAGKLTEAGFEPTGHLDRPPLLLRNATIYLESNMGLGDEQFWDYLKDVEPKHLTSTSGLSDILYEADNLEQQVSREPRSDPLVHYGLIASGSWVIKTSGTKREDLLKRVQGEVLCFEMEACGLMNTFPCIVVRGISDYCDSHKNNGWHKFASTTAACYCKCLLGVISPDDIEEEPTAAKVTNQIFAQNQEILNNLGQLASVNADAHRILTDIQRFMTRIPSQVCRDNPVVLIDPMGRVTPFHLEFIRSTEALLAVLEVNLRRCGSALKKIRSGEFLFTDLRRNRPIDLKTDWEFCFQPGQIVGMSMVFRIRHKISDDVEDPSTCPGCGTVSNKRNSEETECLVCGMVFTRIVDVSDDHVDQIKQRVQNVKLFPLEDLLTDILDFSRDKRTNDYSRMEEHYGGSTPSIPVDENDISMFRRVSLLRSDSRQQSRKVWCAVKAWQWTESEYQRGETAYGWSFVMLEHTLIIESSTKPGEIIFCLDMSVSDFIEGEPRQNKITWRVRTDYGGWIIRFNSPSDYQEIWQFARRYEGCLDGRTGPYWREKNLLGESYYEGRAPIDLRRLQKEPPGLHPQVYPAYSQKPPPRQLSMVNPRRNRVEAEDK